MTPEERKKLIEDMEKALIKNCLCDDNSGNGVKAALAIAERRIREDCADIIKRKIDALEQEFGRSIRSSNLEEARAAILASIPEKKDDRA